MSNLLEGFDDKERKGKPLKPASLLSYGGTDIQSALTFRVLSKIGDVPPAFVGKLNQPSILSQTTAPYTPNNVNGYSNKTLYAISVNFCIGIGVLGLPLGFNNTGYILSSIILLFISLMSYINTIYLLNTMARAEGLIKLMDDMDENSTTDELYTPSLLNNELKPVARFHQIGPIYQITNRRFEVNQLCGIFLGNKWRRIYEIMIVITIICGCWGFTSVFGSAFTRYIIICVLDIVCYKA